MKIIIISDTHGYHRELNLPQGDLIIHCGDFCHYGSDRNFLDFNDWYSALDYKHKILISGNHDFISAEYPEKFMNLLSDNIIYLNDSGVEIQGIKFWGSPVQPDLVGWAFGRKRGDEMEQHWKLIPNDINFLITHTPPKGILDKSGRGAELGCGRLLKKVEKLKPKFHVFGHVHRSYGIKNDNGTTFINASNMDSAKGLVNKPFIVEWKKSNIKTGV